MNETELEIERLSAEQERLMLLLGDQSDEQERLLLLIKNQGDELDEISDARTASGRHANGAPRRSERDSLLYEEEQRPILVGAANRTKTQWTRANLGLCAMCRHAHLTQTVSEKEAPSAGAGQERVDKAARGEVRDEDREPTVTCLVTHRELKRKVVWCASREELTDDES